MTKRKGIETLSQMDQLMSRICQCGGPKMKRHPFCIACYKLLPRVKRYALYAPLGDGYSAAYANAIAHLKKVKSLEPDEMVFHL